MHGDRFARDVEQSLDDLLRALAASLAEMLVPDDAIPVDEVQRGPIAVVERLPDRIVVIGGHRVIDRSIIDRSPDPLDRVLERELRGVDADYGQPVITIGV